MATLDARGVLNTSFIISAGLVTETGSAKILLNSQDLQFTDANGQPTTSVVPVTDAVFISLDDRRREYRCVSVGLGNGCRHEFGDW